MANVIVVGVDGSESSRLAAGRAAELARSMVAQLHIVTAVENATVEEIPDRPGATQITSGELAEAIAADVAAELEGIVPGVCRLV